MTEPELVRAVEAMLLVSGEPVTPDRLRRAILDVYPEAAGSASDELPERIKRALAELTQADSSRPLELRETAGGYRYVARAEFAPLITSLKGQQPPGYSRATLETLSIIAWRQPVTRGEIEQIRGVRLSSSTLRALVDRDWVRVTGHRETPGRPALYGTTRAFLDYFGLKRVEDLPAADELTADSMQDSLIEKSAQR